MPVGYKEGWADVANRFLLGYMQGQRIKQEKQRLAQEEKVQEALNLYRMRMYQLAKEREAKLSQYREGLLGLEREKMERSERLAEEQRKWEEAQKELERRFQAQEAEKTRKFRSSEAEKAFQRELKLQDLKDLAKYGQEVGKQLIDLRKQYINKLVEIDKIPLTTASPEEKQAMKERLRKQYEQSVRALGAEPEEDVVTRRASEIPLTINVKRRFWPDKTIQLETAEDVVNAYKKGHLSREEAERILVERFGWRR